MDTWHLGAAALSAAIALLHIFAGGVTVARPLLASRDLEATAKFTQYYCWHLVSIVLVLMAAGFGVAALDATETGLALVMTALAAAFAFWGLVLPPSVGQSFARMPQGWLFLPVAVLGGLGLAL